MGVMRGTNEITDTEVLHDWDTINFSFESRLCFKIFFILVQCHLRASTVLGTYRKTQGISCLPGVPREETTVFRGLAIIHPRMFSC